MGAVRREHMPIRHLGRAEQCHVPDTDTEIRCLNSLTCKNQRLAQDEGGSFFSEVEDHTLVIRYRALERDMSLLGQAVEVINPYTQHGPLHNSTGSESAPSRLNQNVVSF